MAALGNKYTRTKGIWKLAQVLECPAMSKQSTTHLNGRLASSWDLYPVEVCISLVWFFKSG